MGPADSPFQGQGGEQNDPFVEQQEQRSTGPQELSIERRQNQFAEQHDPSVGQYNPFVEQDDPFVRHGDDEQSELSFSSAIGTPSDTLHSFIHHRETTV